MTSRLAFGSRNSRRSWPCGVKMMPRPVPKLYLYSCGWTDAPDHKETVSGGLVFDIGNVGHDYKDGAPRWEVFGGEGAEMDVELANTKELADRLELVKVLCTRYLDCLQSAPQISAMIVSLICNYGKHRSRWLVKQCRIGLLMRIHIQTLGSRLSI